MNPKAKRREGIYRIPIEDCTDFGMSLRVEPVRGGPKTTIRWARDYQVAPPAGSQSDPAILAVAG